MHKAMQIIGIFVAMLSLNGCMTTHHNGADAQNSLSTLTHPYLNQALFNQNVNIDGVSDINTSSWWTLYNDPELNALITKAFSNNPNLNQIRARIEQARAQTRLNRSTLLPSLDIGLERRDFDGDNDPNSDYQANGSALYEIDLWGKNRASVKSAKASQKASLEDLYTAGISLSAAIVENWLDILALSSQEVLLRKQIKVNRTVLDLQEKRFEYGSSSALDVLQQEENLASSKAQLPDILSAQSIAANNIATLAGDIPNNALNINQNTLPDPLVIPAAGLPSDLLKNRPDIVAAWQRVKSSEWAAHSAQLDRLPSFNLSALYTTSDSKLGNLFETWLLSTILDLSAPVIDGGRRRAEAVRQKALSDESYYAYLEVVLNAVNEVENALTRNHYQDQKVDAIQDQLNASLKTLEQAQLSYANGESTYINVLNSLNNSQALEQQMVSEKLLQAQERVRLYRALGGQDWDIIIAPKNKVQVKELLDDTL